jgi:hypothetical protein
MATWEDVTKEAPQLAAAVRAAFDAHKHKTMATLRKDGAPRISGTEVDFRDGDVYLGSMWGALKARDLQRDPRVALHNAPLDTELGGGDAKISGRAVEITDPEALADYVHDAAEENDGVEPPQPFHLFRIDVEEMSLVTIGDPADHLVVESWKQGRAGTKRVERR